MVDLGKEEFAYHADSLDGKITILLADDHPLWRKALRGVLDEQEDLKVIAEASDGKEAVQLASQLLPRVVVMDIAMPELNGLEATREIKRKCPDIAVLVLTVHSEDTIIKGVLEAGAAGYLVKNVYDEEVIQAIRSIALGEAVLSNDIFQRVLQQALRYPTNKVQLEHGEKLTVREQEILKLATEGMTNKAIAMKLDLSVGTVKIYFTRIFSKLRVGSRTEAVILGLQAGYIDIPKPK